MAKLKRSALLHFLDSSFGGVTESWFKIGKDVEDMSIELNAETEQITNILDETSTNHTGYAPTADIDTYYADPDDGDFYTNLKDIVMARKSGDDCKTKYLEILIDKTSGSYTAYTEDVLIIPSSYGGATGGVRIPYTINFTGNHVDGTATITEGVPSFSPNTNT